MIDKLLIFVYFQNISILCRMALKTGDALNSSCVNLLYIYFDDIYMIYDHVANLKALNAQYYGNLGVFSNPHESF